MARLNLKIPVIDETGYKNGDFVVVDPKSFVELYKKADKFASEVVLFEDDYLGDIYRPLEISESKHLYLGIKEHEFVTLPKGYFLEGKLEKGDEEHAYNLNYVGRHGLQMITPYRAPVEFEIIETQKYIKQLIEIQEVSAPQRDVVKNAQVADKVAGKDISKKK